MLLFLCHILFCFEMKAGSGTMLPVARRTSPVWHGAILVAVNCFRSKVVFRKYSRQPPFGVAEYSLHIRATVYTTLSGVLSGIGGMS